MDRITRTDGFELLNEKQQLEVLNYEDNFIGLTKSANTSKGAKSFVEWTIHKGKGIEVNKDFLKKMIEKEKKLEAELQALIDKLNNN